MAMSVQTWYTATKRAPAAGSCEAKQAGPDIGVARAKQAVGISLSSLGSKEKHGAPRVCPFVTKARPPRQSAEQWEAPAKAVQRVPIPAVPGMRVQLDRCAGARGGNRSGV